MAERGCDLLVTGFGPYPRVRINPTAQLAAVVARSRQFQRFGLRAACHVFETSYADVGRALPEILERLNPAAVLHLGLAPRSRMIRVETVARGRATILHPDQRRVRPGTVPVLAGPKRTTASPARVLASLQTRRLRARLSNDAGRYLCDFSYHRSLSAAPPGRAVLFIHLPWIGARALPKRARSPRPSFAAMAAALTAIGLDLLFDARLRAVPE